MSCAVIPRFDLAHWPEQEVEGPLRPDSPRWLLTETVAQGGPLGVESYGSMGAVMEARAYGTFLLS
jgi:hypothetical protein